MKRKDAFSIYFELGDDRSYAAVASALELTHLEVQLMAKAESWQANLYAMQTGQPMPTMDEDTRGEPDEDDARMLSIARYLQRQAVEAVKGKPLADVLDEAKLLRESVALEHRLRSGR